MKKKAGKIAALLMFGAICLAGCVNKEPLPESFDEAVVKEEAEKTLAFFNERDYQSIIDMGDENMKNSTTTEQFRESCDPLLDEKGEFKEVTKMPIVGNEDKKSGIKYGGAVMTGEYEQGKIEFSVAFNEDMELVQFLVK